LEALQAVASGQTADGETVFFLEIDRIDQNPYQTRREFDQEALRELAGSIQVQGVLQPVVVRPSPVHPGKEGRFILILGERRLRASKMAGKPTIPVIVKRVSEQQAAEMTLVENLQRQDLNCVEQAEAFANLSTEFKLTQEEIGKRAGVSREQVSNYMRLLALPEGVIGALQKGRLTYSHARVLLQLRDNVQIWKYAQKAIEEKMSVLKLEDLVLGVSAPIGLGEAKKGGGARWVDPNVKAAQRSLEEVLGMRVRIRDRHGRGKILIEYATIDDFDRVVRMLKGK
jgi:ParB family chromosome partitioning protein